MSVTFSYNFLLSFLCVIICWSRYVYARFQTCCSFRSDSVSAVTAAKTYFSDNRSAAHPVSYSVPTITFLAYACSLPIRWNLHTI